MGESRGADWLDRIPAPTIIVAPDLRLLQCNAEAAALLRPRIGGRLPWLERRLLPLLHDESAASVMVRRTRGGRRAYVLRCRRLSSDEALVLFNDCTAELEARWADRAADRRLRAQFGGSPDPMLIEQDARIVWANAAAHGLFAHGGKGLQHVSAAAVLPHDVMTRLANGAQNGVEAVVRGGGGDRHVRVLALPVRYRGREARQLLLLDLSALRTAEENLRESEMLLRRAQRMESVGRLTAGVAHDFNNMLSAIHGHAQLLVEGLPEDSEEREDALEISRAVMRAAELTKQLLSFSRGSPRQESAVNVNAVILGIERLLLRLLGDEHRLRLDLAAELPGTIADVGHIEQIIMNLVVNAREAVQPGGTITIRTGRHGADQAPQNHGTPLEPGDYVMLAVSDTGCGMTHAVRRRIFDPFFTTKADGTGLGLATVLSIVTRLGGAIDVESEPGAGSTFTIMLPTAPSHAG